MRLVDYAKGDLKDDIIAIFADMMDDGFSVVETLYPGTPLLNIVITGGTNNRKFDIGKYKDQILQLLDILKLRDQQLLYATIYTDSGSKSGLVTSIESIIGGNIPPPARMLNNNRNRGSDFRGKQDEFWDALSFNIYMSEEDLITNLTLSICELKDYGE